MSNFDESRSIEYDAPDPNGTDGYSPEAPWDDPEFWTPDPEDDDER